ncbi:oxidoreductase 2-nitropropane dioxygenase family [Aspergillus luchuensis]|uniref:Oxidoreductase 2-nitropropane dioxygenase family n=1 Tax=Aspergillus kawachii TaxID=1069201 RepID=A0A146F5T3_ASPKA|nr:oxidoreductase 2-nitropropane dioxygenase family [Aspergillus luchuensis]
MQPELNKLSPPKCALNQEVLSKDPYSVDLQMEDVKSLHEEQARQGDLCRHN